MSSPLVKPFGYKVLFASSGLLNVYDTALPYTVRLIAERDGVSVIVVLRQGSAIVIVN